VSVALIIQFAKRMRHIILPSVVCPAVPYFLTSYKRYDFQEIVTEGKIRVLISLQILSEMFLIPRKIHPGSMINVPHREFFFQSNGLFTYKA
jgi:hypothetical protein